MLKSKFELQKKRALEKFHEAVEKGEADEPIIDFLEKFNEKEYCYTTSSCAGRIIIFQDMGSKKDSDFIAKWHREIEFSDIIPFLGVLEGKKGTIWLRQEPLILHVVAKDLNHAILILDTAIKSGLKHSGIMVFKDQRYLVEINGTERFDVPIFEEKILVSEEYLKYLVKLADKKFVKSRVTSKKFFGAVMKI